MLLAGRCHCGNIRFDFETGYRPASLPLRACQCSFCRAHGAVTASDPRGRVTFQFAERASVHYYHFGLGVTDMLICKRCGCYVAAVMTAAGRRYATLNANMLERRSELTQVPVPMDYANETRAQRLQRRTARWTPVVAGEVTA